MKAPIGAGCAEASPLLLRDEAKVIHYRHLVGSGVRTLYLPNVSVEVKGTNPAVLPRSLSG